MNPHRQDEQPSSSLKASIKAGLCWFWEAFPCVLLRQREGVADPTCSGPMAAAPSPGLWGCQEEAAELGASLRAQSTRSLQEELCFHPTLLSVQSHHHQVTAQDKPSAEGNDPDLPVPF